MLKKCKATYNMGGACSAYGGEENRVQGFRTKRDHLGDISIDAKIILGWIFRKQNVGVWTGSIWLKIRTGGGHL